MKFIDQLLQASITNNSLLCVGLDPDPKRFPDKWNSQPEHIFDFCAAIVDATADLVNSFKPQIAYFAANRAESQLEKLVRYIKDNAPEVPVILDSKRGDIGSTAEQYAIEAFERYGADAVTLSPFMGYDTIEPYLKYHEKGAFLLCRTSNVGGSELQNQFLDIEGHPRVYEHIAKQAQGSWNTNGQLGLVVGATYPEEIGRIRELAPTVPLLIPGIGAQGGDAKATIRMAWKSWADGRFSPIAINSSRAILYAGHNDWFAKASREQAIKQRDELNAAKPV